MEDDNDVESLTLIQCSNCGRHFREDIINRHKVVCLKSTTKKRKPFDSVKQRIQGIEEANQKILGGASVTKSKETERKIAQIEARKHQWHKKHEEFIKAIRAAKEYTIAKQTGKPLPPPPPPTIDPDLIQCEYCLRRFNEKAAERHIQFCREKHSRLPASNTTSNTNTIGRGRATTITTTAANPNGAGRSNRKSLNPPNTQNNYRTATNSVYDKQIVNNTSSTSTRNTRREIPQLAKPTPNSSTTGARSSGNVQKNHAEMVKPHTSSNNLKETTQSNKRGSSTNQPRQITRTNKSVITAQSNVSKGATNEKSHKFCSECGYTFPNSAARFCPECGVRRIVI
ncbi:Zinc finger C2HC domain-containing protein [Schistosoma japonicum]|uniref:Zinc finger C2HC domain-containing protein n=1 Tax=Schistosoma japonicum TaxID=6182 RepID=A0A4Z2D0V0_SCHJA|nr:Zinc finger C2HC domain-containing protein [Schistosoma japonicum]